MQRLSLSRRLSLSTRWPLFLFIAFAVALRVIYASETDVYPQGDAGAYINYALKFKSLGFWGPDAGRPPLFPMVLVLVSKLFGLGLLDQSTYTGVNCVFDAISIFLLFKLAKRIAPAASSVGVLIVSISPLWFGHVNCAVTEPLSVTLFLAYLERWTREKRGFRDEIWAGVWMSLLTLTRGVFVMFSIGLVVFEVLFRNAPKEARLLDWRRRIGFLVACYTLPFLWGLRNLERLGKFIMTQDDATAILMAWSAIKIPTLDWRIPEHHKQMMDHPWSDVILGRADPARTAEVYGMMKAEVFDFIHHHPFQFVGNFFLKLNRLWLTGWWNPFSYVYSPPYLNVIYVGCFCAPVLLFGLIGLFSQLRAKPSTFESPLATWRAAHIQLYTVLFLSAIALPFTVDARYSLPAYVSFGLWVGAGWSASKVFTAGRATKTPARESTPRKRVSAQRSV